MVDDGGEGLVRRTTRRRSTLAGSTGWTICSPTRDGLKPKYTMLRAGFSDFAFTIEDLFSAEDRVAARVTVRGTHDGEFIGRSATGRSFAVTSVAASGSPKDGSPSTGCLRPVRHAGPAWRPRRLSAPHSSRRSWLEEKSSMVSDAPVGCGSVHTPDCAWTRPSATAASIAAWSRSFWLA